MLKRYTNLRPEDLHRLKTAKPESEETEQRQSSAGTKSVAGGE